MTVPQKIARLVAERGWNQDEFARRVGIHRTTAHKILTRSDYEMHNQTLRRCADALGLSVNELLNEPLEKLLPRVPREASPPAPPVKVDLDSQPVLQAWLAEHPDRAAELSQAELEELVSLHGTGGPLTLVGVEHFITAIERKRVLRRRIEAIAGTEYLDLLEQIVELLYDRIRPYRERV